MTTLPLLVIWGVWLARNKIIFIDKSFNLEITTIMAFRIMHAFPQYIRATRQREVLELEIDRSVSWVFFNVASQNNLCVEGVILFFSD